MTLWWSEGRYFQQIRILTKPPAPDTPHSSKQAQPAQRCAYFRMLLVINGAGILNLQLLSLAGRGSRVRLTPSFIIRWNGSHTSSQPCGSKVNWIWIVFTIITFTSSLSNSLPPYSIRYSSTSQAVFALVWVGSWRRSCFKWRRSLCLSSAPKSS